MRVSLVKLFTCWTLTAVIPSTSNAADWSMLESATVCRHLDWSGAKRIILVGAGENVSDINEALEVLEENMKGCPNVSSITASDQLGNVARLDDESIVTKAAQLPIDLVAVVRVYPGLGGQSSLFATFFNLNGETVTAISVDTEHQRSGDFSAGFSDAQSLELDSLESPGNRHRGLFFRINWGFGFGSASSTSGGDTMKIAGPAGIAEFSAGHVLIENLVGHISINGPLMIAPEVSMNGHTFGGVDVEMNSVGFGLGLTYYFMPYNFYLTSIFGAVAMEGKLDGERVSTEKGLSIQLSAGKEWLVYEKLGLGVAGAVIYQRMKDGEGYSAYWNNVALGVLFSATYF